MYPNSTGLRLYGGTEKIDAITSMIPTSQTTGNASVMMAQIAAGFAKVPRGVSVNLIRESWLYTP